LRATTRMQLHLGLDQISSKQLEAVKEALNEWRGSIPVEVHITADARAGDVAGSVVVLTLREGVTPAEPLLSKFEQIFGESVTELVLRDTAQHEERGGADEGRSKRRTSESRV
jgi:hypothetical protein